jgi:two-component system response regulator HydG
MDVRMTKLDGIEALRRIHAYNPAIPVIIMTAYSSVDAAVEAIKIGAHDYLTKPLDFDRLKLTMAHALDHRQIQENKDSSRNHKALLMNDVGIIGSSGAMRELMEMVSSVAPTEATVLISGESGTGKELIAAALHHNSSRKNGPFVKVNCAALVENLLESELFGHEKGAFTGAVGLRRGRLEIADRGTLFLDEIGDLGLALQPKLLRVLQERTFERLGSSTPVNVNLRVICATNRNLGEMIQQGKFREDLYYRLNVVELHLPPLRERRDDIPVLAYCFLERFASQFGKKVKRFSRLSLQAMEEYNWPGNVRELENVVQRVVVLSETETVEVWQLPPAVRSGYEEPQPELTYEEEVRRFKRRLLVRTLRECGWRKAKSARTLGVARGYLHRLMHQLEISEDDLGEAARGISD